MVHKIGRFFNNFAFLLWLFSTTVWSALAINFGDSHSSNLQLLCAGAVILLGLVTVIAKLVTWPWRNKLFWAYNLLFVMVILWWFNIEPANERQWQTDVSKLAHASIQGGRVTMHNIRNFSYRSEFDYQPDYYDKTFDLKKLEGLDLFAVYWMGPAIAHIIISFDFGDDNHLSVSIEARKEINEGYSTIKGFFRQYELIYIVADERDLIGLRTHYRHNPPEHVYRYRLKLPKENIKRFFLEYIENINALYEKPAFYNTLLANCTTIIWLNSRVNPGHLPFSWKILLSGYLPEYIYDSGGFGQQLSFADLKRQAYINPLVKGHEITALFSTAIRPQHTRAK